jgi:hypothetical protein
MKSCGLSFLFSRGGQPLPGTGVCGRGAAGVPGVALGGILWILVATSSLGLQWLTGQL